MLHPKTDIGGHIVAKIANNGAGAAGIPSLVTAAGTGDATKVTGQTINNINGGQSGVLLTSFVAALTDTKSLSFTVEIQESADGSTWDTAEVLQAATVAVLADSTTNFHGVQRLEVDLKKRKQYVRFNVTPDLSHSGTDTCTWSSVLVVGGDDVLDAA